MSNMTNMDLQALNNFANALENFKQNVTVHCNNMESGIAECQQFMKDANSQKALRDGQQICTDIKASLNPAEMLLEKVRRMIQLLHSAPEM